MLSVFGSSLARSLKILARNKVGFMGFILTMVIIIVALVAPFFVHADTSVNAEAINVGPSAAHLLGGDYQGRDTLKNLLTGGRDIIYVAVATAVMAAVIAIVLGALAAMLGGAFDSLAVSLAEMIMTIPQFPLLVVLAGFLKLNSPIALAFILAALSWAPKMLSIRSQVLSLKERDYVQAARCLGLPNSHLLFKEILPNMMSFVVIMFVLNVTSAMYAQVGLIFLGIVPMAASNWGVMITQAWNQGAVYDPDARWSLLVPVAVVVLLQYSLVTMNRSLDELFNPRLRMGD